MITVKYFGSVADVTQKKEEQFPADGSLYELKADLELLYPGIRRIKYALALNQAIAKEDARLNTNDEIALLPPFAGG